MTYNEIMSECYIDSTLVAVLMNARVNHKHSCCEVAREMKKGHFKDRFAIGIIDNDKKQNPYTASFIEIGRTDNLTFLKHSEKPHYLIKIGKPHKAMEAFIIETVSRMGMKMEDFRLPSDLDELLKVTKDSISTLKDSRILHLCKSIAQSPEVIILTMILDYLVKNRYSAKLEIIKSIIQNPNPIQTV